tara:strand:- start:828 stop:1238 length:411 start_codon:yes stop_codon:yes gene_type:complete
MGINSTEVSYGFGQLGSAYTKASSDAITPPTGKVFVAITMLADTIFDDSAGLVADRILVPGANSTANSVKTGDIYIGTEQPANDLATATTDEGAGGLIIGGTTEADAVTFPKGITIYGRWTEIDVYSGSVVAYIGE